MPSFLDAFDSANSLSWPGWTRPDSDGSFYGGAHALVEGGLGKLTLPEGAVNFNAGGSIVYGPSPGTDLGLDGVWSWTVQIPNARQALWRTYFRDRGVGFYRKDCYYLDFRPASSTLNVGKFDAAGTNTDLYGLDGWITEGKRMACKVETAGAQLRVRAWDAATVEPVTWNVLDTTVTGHVPTGKMVRCQHEATESTVPSGGLAAGWEFIAFSQQAVSGVNLSRTIRQVLSTHTG